MLLSPLGGLNRRIDLGHFQGTTKRHQWDFKRIAFAALGLTRAANRHELWEKAEFYADTYMSLHSEGQQKPAQIVRQRLIVAALVAAKKRQEEV